MVMGDVPPVVTAMYVTAAEVVNPGKRPTMLVGPGALVLIPVAVVQLAAVSKVLLLGVIFVQEIA
jgi:hypothetical protein